ncbi:MAG: HK97 gp10 family phage protein [Brevundimonas mediterranea]|uniref:HK97 gp10 family phage protein n=1 Tax=Brevundimonas mediterranea TaxID=74329 RepID=UPI004034E261
MSWTGLGDFETYLKKAREDAASEARRACQVSADELVQRVKNSVPKGDPRNGHITDSVHAYKKDEDTFAVKIGGEATPYAAALEFGHTAPDGSRVPPQKVFFPNVRVINKKHGRRIRRWFRKAIKDSGAV